MKLETAGTELKFSSRELKLDFSAILKIIAAQRKRKARLQQLHYELAAAYYGKEGAPQARTYCETLIGKDSLNRDSINSLLGHIEKYIKYSEESFYENSSLKNQLASYVDELKQLTKQSFIDIAAISLVTDHTEKLIKAIDHQTKESKIKKNC